MGKLNSRIVILSIAVIVIGLFAMPTTLSLFSGQHTFKNGTEVSCEKCHEDIYQELILSSAHWRPPQSRGFDETQDIFKCQECHSVTNISQYYIQKTSTRADTHAATTVSCLDCHSVQNYNDGGPNNPYHILAKRYGKFQGSYDYTVDSCGQCHRDGSNPNEANVIINVVGAITGSDESHTEFYYQSKYPDNQTDVALKEANTACIGCHTHSGINITWVRSVGYNINADLTTGNWNMSFSVNQTTVNTTSAGN